MCGQPGDNTRPYARLPPSCVGMGVWMTSQLKVSLIRKLHGSLMCSAHDFDMLFMGVCTTEHWQTSGRLVQELNVCTVYVPHIHESVLQVELKLIVGGTEASRNKYTCELGFCWI